uniref:Uncharacterized protein n=1 Tax=Anguilla anguilla TaxID=7936 RepID=A0A0E9XPA9_ANGAN
MIKKVMNYYSQHTNFNVVELPVNFCKM